MAVFNLIIIENDKQFIANMKFVSRPRPIKILV